MRAERGGTAAETKPWRWRRADLFIIAPGELHDSSGLAHANRWVVAFGADALDPERSDGGIFLDPSGDLLLLSFLRPQGTQGGHFHVAPDDRPSWLARLAQLEHELRSQGLGYTEAARALLVLLLTESTRLATEHAPSVPAHRPLLTRVFRYIEAHYHEPISLHDVAAALGHAPAYLTSLVRRETGQTVLSWIVERRMAEARYLLLETDQTVRQVAAAVGYGQAGHFIRQFRRRHGQTPLAWRQARNGSIPGAT